MWVTRQGPPAVSSSSAGHPLQLGQSVALCEKVSPSRRTKQMGCRRGSWPCGDNHSHVQMSKPVVCITRRLQLSWGLSSKVGSPRSLMSPVPHLEKTLLACRVAVVTPADNSTQTLPYGCWICLHGYVCGRERACERAVKAPLSTLLFLKFSC